MAEIKSYEFAKKPLNQLLYSHFVFIFYGPDRGLIAELINQFEKRIDVSHHDPFSFIILNSVEIQKHPEKLLNEIDSIGLFNKKKIIFIDNLYNEQKVMDLLEDIVLKNMNNHLIIIKSSEIKKDHRLRKIGEKNSSVLSISCYPDNKIDLKNLIKEELLFNKQQISSDAEQIILKYLGGDRIASRNELQKISSYCLEENIIKEEHVKDIISDTHILYVEDIIDYTLQGDIYNAILMVENFFASKMPAYTILNGLLRRFQLLDQINTEVHCSGISINQAIQKFEKTRIPKKRILLEKLLKIWHINTIKKIIYKIDQEIQVIRKKAILEKSIISQNILLIARIARKKQNTSKK